MQRRLSSWVNLQDVFKANAGQGERMNETVYGGLEQQGAAAQGALQQAGMGFANAARNSARGTLAGMDGRTAAGAQKAGQATYTGPRTLKEYDPNVGAQIGEAAQRIGASQVAQYANQYKGGSAGGGALDRALMNHEGGQERAEKLKGKYGSLLDEYRAEMAEAAATGADSEASVRAEAGRLGALAPGLFQQEQERRIKANHDRIQRENDAKRAAYDAEWERRTSRFKRRRGNQLQASYAFDIPSMEERPLYDDGSGDTRPAY